LQAAPSAHCLAPGADRGPGDFLRARETRGGWMTCDTGRMELLSWSVSYPPLSAVVPDARMECGPDVAPRSRAWKAHTAVHDGRGRGAMAQVRDAGERLGLTVVDRACPFVGARRGHGRRGRPWLGPGGNGHQLSHRARFVQGDHLRRWQAATGGAAALARGGGDTRGRHLRVGLLRG